MARVKVEAVQYSDDSPSQGGDAFLNILLRTQEEKAQARSAAQRDAATDGAEAYRHCETEILHTACPYAHGRHSSTRKWMCDGTDLRSVATGEHKARGAGGEVAGGYHCFG